MRDNILKDVYANDKVELSSIDVKLAGVNDVEKMSLAVENLLIQYTKTIDELKQKGGMLLLEYNKVLNTAKSLGIDAEPLMRESGKSIGKLKMYKLL